MTYDKSYGVPFQPFVRSTIGRSAICGILSSVCRPSVRPSVCNAVQHCGPHGRCTLHSIYMAKSCTSVFLVRQVPICPFRLGTNTHRIKRIDEPEFFETQKTTSALVYSASLTVENLRRSTSRTLLVTLEWIAFGCVHKLYLDYVTSRS